MNVRELGMQIAREQVTAACQAAGTAIDDALYAELTGRLYGFICKVKALEFGAEYYKALLAQVDTLLGGEHEANFANVPGKAGAIVARLDSMLQAKAGDKPRPAPTTYSTADTEGPA